jgi:hypothetical protein
VTFDEITKIRERSGPANWYEVPALAGWDSFLWTLSISTFSRSAALPGPDAEPSVVSTLCLFSPIGSISAREALSAFSRGAVTVSDRWARAHRAGPQEIHRWRVA